MIPFDRKLRVPENVLVQVVEGESVLLSLRDRCYYGLDATGTRMWELLTTSDSIHGAYCAMLDEFDVEPERLRGDLLQFVESLVSNGLLEAATQEEAPGGAVHE